MTRSSNGPLRVGIGGPVGSQGASAERMDQSRILIVEGFQREFVAVDKARNEILIGQLGGRIHFARIARK